MQPERSCKVPLSKHLGMAVVIDVFVHVIDVERWIGCVHLTLVPSVSMMRLSLSPQPILLKRQFSAGPRRLGDALLLDLLLLPMALCRRAEPKQASRRRSGGMRYGRLEVFAA